MTVCERTLFEFLVPNLTTKKLRNTTHKMWPRKGFLRMWMKKYAKRLLMSKTHNAVFKIFFRDFATSSVGGEAAKAETLP